MTQEQFVDALKIAVTESSVKGVVSALESPPGRKPKDLYKKLSEWYNGLDAADKNMVVDIVRLSIDHGVFGFLCVIDGVRAIAGGDKSGEFTLSYKDVDGESILNDPNEDYLHDLYNAE
ncbi:MULTISPECIES: hypothetical protein [Olivibacter]|uniref:Uncharacterized protein n=1 Tax=Olivibacter jilunii TaxID=985016 RepID=A0ABW6BB49_9SPHI|nr:hypothetical protein [Olivibacter sp. UJ_SKK_5.1]MDX3912718.1 hypothetical protein [Pseudosphingobacterium sp.]